MLIFSIVKLRFMLISDPQDHNTVTDEIKKMYLLKKTFFVIKIIKLKTYQYGEKSRVVHVIGLGTLGAYT